MIDDAFKFWAKRSISDQKVGFKGSTFKGSEVGRRLKYYPIEIMELIF